MPTYPLAYRITNYLRRQIAWSEAVIAELDAFCEAPTDVDVEPVLARQRQREQETRALAREYQGLAHEWAGAADMPADDQAEIVQLSHEARALMDQVQARYDRADAAARDRHDQSGAALNDLRRGRRSVNIYGRAASASPGFIDKRA